MFITKKKLDQMLSEREMKGREERDREMQIMENRSEMYRIENRVMDELSKVERKIAEMERTLYPDKHPHSSCPFEIVKE